MGTHGGPGITARGQEEPKRRHQQGLLEQTCSLAVALQACVKSDIVVSLFRMNCHDLEYLSRFACRHMYIL